MKIENSKLSDIRHKLLNIAQKLRDKLNLANEVLEVIDMLNEEIDKNSRRNVKRNNR